MGFVTEILLEINAFVIYELKETINLHNKKIVLSIFSFSTINNLHILRKYSTVGPRTERILGQEKTRSAQNRSDWGQAYVVKCKNTKKCVQFEFRLI